eukprot:752115-Hanusia_phi.AAC.2
MGREKRNGDDAEERGWQEGQFEAGESGRRLTPQTTGETTLVASNRPLMRHEGLASRSREMEEKEQEGEERRRWIGSRGRARGAQEEQEVRRSSPETDLNDGNVDGLRKKDLER